MDRFTVFLIGFSGSGKSTIGKLLAKQTNGKCFDIDYLIEKKEKMQIADIFKKRSESYFRQCETEMITEVIKKTGKKKIISLGGGAFESNANRKLIQQNGISIYLSCSQRELYNRMKNASDRPLLNDAVSLKEKIKLMMRKRLPHYKKADFKISTTSMTPKQTAAKIKREILCHVSK